MLSTFVVLATLSFNGPSNFDYVQNHRVGAIASVYAINMAIGCLKSGIGMSYHGGTFSEGCIKGLFAGSVTFMGEALVARENYYPGMGAAGKLTHDLGLSMEDNLMRGESILSSYQTDIGPVTLNFSGGIIPNWKISPIATIALGAIIYKGYHFDIHTSLANLTPVFNYTHTIINGTLNYSGFTLTNVVAYEKMAPVYVDFNGKQVDVAAAQMRGNISHELIHTTQWSNYRFCDSLINVSDHLDIGRELCVGLTTLLSITPATYFMSPEEMEAYAMERSN